MKFAFLISLCLSGLILTAQSPFQDSTFHDDGISVVSAGQGYEGCYTSAMQDDEKMVIAGFGSYETGSAFIAIIRLLPEGIADPSFGVDGIAIHYVNTDGFGSPALNGVVKVIIQPDGKILLIGTVENIAVAEYNYDLFIMRLMPDGSRDPSFGTDGFNMYGFYDDWGYFLRDYARSAALLPDGKIVIIGDTGPYSEDQAFIMRILPNGLIDGTFGTEGSYRININIDTWASDVAVLADSSIVMAGHFNTGQYIFFAKWNADGSYDSTFGVDGIHVDSTVALFNLKRMALTPSEEFILMGDKNSTVIINKYLSDGKPDTTFHFYELPHPTSNYYSESICLGPEGEIFFSYHSSGSIRDFMLGKLTPQGLPDGTFGGDGIGQYDIGQALDDCKSINLAGDKVVASGNAVFNYNNDIAAIRIFANGDLDDSYANEGKWHTDIGRSADYGHSIALTSENKIIMAGDGNYAIVARVDQNGHIDSTFHNDGITSFQPFGYYYSPTVTSVGILSNDRMVILSYDYDLLLTRLYPNGNVDPTFNGGSVRLLTGDEEYYYAYDIAVQEDDKVLFSGIYYSYSFFYDAATFLVGRLNENGTFDSTFAGDGLKYDVDLPEDNNIARAVTVMPDGRIVAGGYYLKDNGNQFLRIVRYMTDGTWDTTFAEGGVYGATVNGKQGRLLDLKIDSEDRVVAAGYQGAYENDIYQILVTRVTADGEIDLSFSDDGYFIYDTPYEASARSVAIDDSGRIVVSGYAYIDVANAAFFTLRLLGDGTPDTTFGIDGMLFIDLTPQDDISYSMVLQDDGKILLGGTASENVNADFALVRLLPNYVIPEPIDHDTTFGSFLVFPNPVHGAFTLQYQLLEAQSVSISLFDVAGRQVAQLLTNELQDAGEHQESLVLPEMLAGGSYYLQITCGDTAAMVQIVVI